jgi:hypothetical protein
MHIDGRSEIWVMSEEVALESNIRWKRADWTIITVDGNRSDLSIVAESVRSSVHRIVIAMPIFLARSRSEQVILGCHWETYTRKCERNLDNVSCDITT